MPLSEETEETKVHKAISPTTTKKFEFRTRKDKEKINSTIQNALYNIVEL